MNETMNEFRHKALNGGVSVLYFEVIEPEKILCKYIFCNLSIAPES